MKKILTVLILATLCACGGGSPTPNNTKSISGTVSIPTIATSVNAPFEPNQVLVKFRTTVSAQATRLSIAGVRLQTIRSLGLENTRLLSSSSNDITAVVAALQTRADVEWAQPNYSMQAQAVPNDTNYNLQWHYQSINLPQAWDIENGSSNPVTVAVIDTGILAGHPDFAGKILPGYDMISDSSRARDGNGRDPNPEDVGDKVLPAQSSYHGSHVAGTIAAATNNTVGVAGVSWGAKILPVRVLGLNGTGSSADIIDAMYWAAGLAVSGVPNNPNPAAILNLSLGGDYPCSQSPAYQAAINAINTAGKIIVVAAGNENLDASQSTPASCSGVITVGATDFAKARAPYSNFGLRIDLMAPGGDNSQDLDNDGFGDGVLSLSKNDTSGNFNYTYKNGTSMATPHVAGVIALLKSRDPSLNYSRALDILSRTAQPLTATKCTGSGTAKTSADCGAGLIDAQAALQALTNNADFSLSLTPSSLSLVRGSSGTATLTLTNTNGFSGSVSYTVSGAPAGVTLSLSGTTLNIVVASGVAVGDYAIRIIGTSGALERRVELNVSVLAAPIVAPSVANTLVLACFYLAATDSCDTTKSKELTLTATGSSATYNFAQLETGTYQILAWKDSNNDTNINNGDYIGIYNGGPITPSAVGIDLSLSLVQGTSSLAEKRLRTLLK